jgi:hypothetical protein
MALFFDRQDVFLSDKNSLRNFHLSKKPLARRGTCQNSQLVFPMADFNKLRGRPSLKQGKRVKKIDARFTLEEYQLVLEMEKELGVSKTELVRMRLLNEAGHIVVNAKELLKTLDAIGAEMGRIGNNINQLAKHANTIHMRGEVPPFVALKFNLLIADYIKIQQLLDAAFRKLIRSMGR